MLKEVRCRHCGKLLAKGGYEILEIKCPRCKTINTLERPRVPNLSGDSTRGNLRKKPGHTGQYRLHPST